MNIFAINIFLKVILKKKLGLCILFLLIFFGVFAQKTDLVILNNGDHITGELKKLDLEILQLKTSYMSTAQIKWIHVKNLFAPDKYVEVVLTDKTKLFGRLDSIEIPNAIKLVSEIGEFNIPTSNVVTIQQVKRVFWNRFSGSLGAGVSFTKASEVFQTNYNANINYTGENIISDLSISSIQTTQPDRYTSKYDYMGNVKRKTFKSQYTTVFAGVQQNTELDMERRSIIGAGYGFELLHTSIARISFALGAIGNNELTVQDKVETNNAEGFVALDTRVFKYTDPEIYINGGVNYYPSMTVAGRNRAEVNLKVKVELFNNFFLEVNFYDNYDSRPVSENAATNDYGIISSFQYTFGL